MEDNTKDSNKKSLSFFLWLPTSKLLTSLSLSILPHREGGAIDAGAMGSGVSVNAGHLTRLTQTALTFLLMQKGFGLY